MNKFLHFLICVVTKVYKLVRSIGRMGSGKYLLDYQGGLVNHDHEKWLEKCEEVTLNRDGELVTMSSSQPTTPSKNIFKVLICFGVLNKYKNPQNAFSIVNGHLQHEISFFQLWMELSILKT